MGRNDEPTRLPPGYGLDLLGDPCVIVLRRADGTVVARFSPFADPMETMACSPAPMSAAMMLASNFRQYQ